MSIRLEDDARIAALDSFLEQRVAEGFVIESRTITHAIIAPKRPLLRLPTRMQKSRTSGRQVIEVDQFGGVTASPAQPVRW